MLFELIFISLYLAGWLACGFAPWLAASVATRGHAGLHMLPVCLFGGVVGGLAVPILIRQDLAGLVMSFAAAVLVPAGLMAAQRIALSARREEATEDPAKVGEPE
ncbi:MAG: hypothetical protein Kow0010_00240 [Dehalococcoidia bacterium]